jgi:hypothetical protein
MAGILAPTMGHCQSGIDGGVASGIVGRDTDALSHALDKELEAGVTR